MPVADPAMRVAIIHYWLVGMRGGEKVIEALCRMFPQADIFTHVHVPDAMSDTIKRHKVSTSFIANLPMAPRLYQKYLPFMPRALEQIDLTGYDLVISSESGPAKGVIAPPDAPHLCYVHSPMRYLWDHYHIYRDNAGLVSRLMMPHLVHPLRQWDVTSAARVDGFAANSNFVAARVKKYWRRDADVVHPPVFVSDFAPVPAKDLGDFYLWAGELAPYKRPDLAIDAFTKMGKNLVVIGGPDKTRHRLAASAGPTVSFLGQVPFDVLKSHMARCKGLIYPGEEDFGIVPVEVMASGRPVIAYGRGGALDTVKDNETGILFDTQSVDGLIQAVERCETDLIPHLNPQSLVQHAAMFDETAFQRGIATALRAIGADIQF